MGNRENGKTICMVIGAYMVVKGLLNLVLGFGLGNIVTLVVSAALAYTLVTHMPYCNYITGAYLAVIFLVHIAGNISGGQWLYLIEGIIDVIAAVILFINPDVKAHFSSQEE